MDYYHARANVCRAGVTHAGLADHPFTISVGGTTRTTSILQNQFSVTASLDGTPSTCAFMCEGFTPTEGQDVVITLGGEMVWAGTLTEVDAVVQKFGNGAVFWSCQAVDWTWLLDRYERVTLDVGENTAVNQAIGTIVREHTDGGFQTGYIEMDLDAVGPMQIRGETVSEAIRRIVAAAGAYGRLRPTKAIDVFTTLPTSNALTITNSSDIRSVWYQRSISTLRTRTYYAGGGGSTTAAVASNATTIAVDECGWYTGTQALVGPDIIGYTGRSVSQGPGSLTGVTGVVRDIPQGETVAVLAQADDATAQTALATLLGGGRSGIAVGWFGDARLTQSEVTLRAAADVAHYKDPIPALRYTTSARWHEPGKTVSVTLTDPITASGTFRIQSVVMKPFGAVAGNTPSFEYQVTCRVHRRADVLD